MIREIKLDNCDIYLEKRKPLPDGSTFVKSVKVNQNLTKDKEEHLNKSIEFFEELYKKLWKG